MDEQQSNTESEIVLKGGRANTGRVVRIGDQVARPTYPQTETVNHFLEHLHRSGVTQVPEPIGFDSDGRSRVSFIPGTAPTPPYPEWAFSEELLIEVAGYQRALHAAATSYVAPVGAVWAVSAGDYFPAAAIAGRELVVCHNDLGMTNVIVSPDTHRVSGLIDFDYCRPVDRLFDIAVAIRHWAPFGDLDLAGAPEIDRVRRFRLFCDVHELSADERGSTVDLARAFLDKARANIAALAAAGQGSFQQLLDSGYEATNLATVAWLTEHREALATLR